MYSSAIRVGAESAKATLSTKATKGWDQAFAALTQSLTAYAQNVWNLQGAAELFARLAQHRESGGDKESEAGVYHQLGRIAQEHRDFAAAEQWSRKSLAIKEKQGNEHGVAISYGLVAHFSRSQSP